MFFPDKVSSHDKRVYAAHLDYKTNNNCFNDLRISPIYWKQIKDSPKAEPRTKDSGFINLQFDLKNTLPISLYFHLGKS